MVSNAHALAKVGPQVAEPPPGAESEGGTGRSCPGATFTAAATTAPATTVPASATLLPPSLLPQSPRPPPTLRNWHSQTRKTNATMSETSRALQNGSLLIQGVQKYQRTQRKKPVTRGVDNHLPIGLPTPFPLSRLSLFGNFLSKTRKPKRERRASPLFPRGVLRAVGDAGHQKNGIPYPKMGDSSPFLSSNLAPITNSRKASPLKEWNLSLFPH